MILHLSQIFLTLALTFIGILVSLGNFARPSFVSIKKSGLIGSHWSRSAIRKDTPERAANATVSNPSCFYSSAFAAPVSAHSRNRNTPSPSRGIEPSGSTHRPKVRAHFISACGR